MTIYAVLETVILQLADTPLPSTAAAVILALPFLYAVTRPVSLTEATEASELLHTTSRTFAVSGLAVAVSWYVSSACIVLELALSETEVTGWNTVTVQLALFFPTFTLIVAVPTATPVTRPTSVTVATEVLDDFQVTISLQSSGVIVRRSFFCTPLAISRLVISSSAFSAGVSAETKVISFSFANCSA